MSALGSSVPQFGPGRNLEGCDVNLCAEADGPMDGAATYPGFFRRVCGNCGRPATVIDQRGDSWCDACADEEDGDAS